MSNKLAFRKKFPLFNQNSLFNLDVNREIFSGFEQFFGDDIGINFHSNVIEVPVPGYTDKDITIHLEDGILSVKGERKTEHSSSSISKSFSIPEKCDPSKIEAKLENGLLTLTFGLLEDKKSEAKQIPINSK